MRKEFNFLAPAVFSGTLTVLCYAPFHFWYLAYVCLVPLLWAASHATAMQRAILHIVCGVIFVSGVYHGMATFSLWVFLFVAAIFTLFFWLWGELHAWLTAHYTGVIAAVVSPAVLWVGMEALAVSPWLGLPMHLGASQAGVPVVIQSAAIFGIFSISFLVMLSNTALAYCLQSWRSGERFRVQHLVPAGVVLALLLGNTLYGSIRLRSSSLAAPTIPVATVQPLISSEIYANGWRIPANRQFMRETMEKLTGQALASGARLVIWAEGGNGYMNMRVPDLREGFYETARANGVGLLISTNDLDEEGRKYNSLFSISPDGALLGRYDKVRLAPFSEADYTASQEEKPLATAIGKVGAAICFESILPSHLRRMSARGAELLLVTSSDAKFKRSSVVFGHAALAIFRAVENGKWLVRAANSGPSLIISPQGVVTEKLGLYQSGVMTGKVNMIQARTFFTRFGYLVPNAFGILVLFLCGWRAYDWLLGLAWLAKPGNNRPVVRKSGTRGKQRVRPPGKRLFPIEWKMVSRVLHKSAIHVIGTLLAILVLTMASIYTVGASCAAPASLGANLKDLFGSQNPAPLAVGERFLQADNNTCGAAALSYILSYLGRETEEKEILQNITLRPDGISMADLRQATQRLGFEASGYTENYQALQKEVLPALAYINNSHYVVVSKVETNLVYLFDPNMGHVKVSRSQFMQGWNGYMLAIRVRPIT